MSNQRFSRLGIEPRACEDVVKAIYVCVEIVGGVVHVPEAVLEHRQSGNIVGVSSPSSFTFYIVSFGLEREDWTCRVVLRRG